MDIMILLGAVGGVLAATGFIILLRTDKHVIKAIAACFIGLLLIFIANS
jgi:hypothetical protein